MTRPAGGARYLDPGASDLTGTGFDDFRAWMGRMRDEAAVHALGGMYQVFRAADVRRVLTDTSRFGSDRTRFMPATAQLGPGNLTMMDPPEHGRVRQTVNRAFAPDALRPWRAVIERVAAELVDALPEGPFDLVSRLAYPLPIRVIVEVLGLSELDLEQFSHWSAGFSRGDTAQLDELHAFLLEVLALRRRRPQPDLVSRLAAAGHVTPAAADETAALIGLLLLAGHVTTTSLIAGAAFEATTRPEVAESLRVHDAYDDLVEETLRVRPAFAQVTRVTRGPVTLAGSTIPDGTIVCAWVLSANHDPTLNPSPAEFDLHRPARRHLAFGHGAHYCLGSHLARLEATITLRCLVRRFGRLEIAGPVAFHPAPTLSVRNLPVQGRRT